MERRTWDARSPKAGERAHDSELLDEAGKPLRISQLASDGPLILLFVRSHESPECLQQLLRYRDATLSFRKLGARIAAVAPAEPTQLAWLRSERGIGFSLLADPQRKAIEEWGLLDRGDPGAAHPALFVIGKDRLVKLRALEAARAAPEAIAQFIRRGGSNPAAGAGLAARLQRLRQALNQALRPARLVR